MKNIKSFGRKLWSMLICLSIAGPALVSCGGNEIPENGGNENNGGNEDKPQVEEKLDPAVVSTLEKGVEANVEAIQSMIMAGCVSSYEINATNGNATIHLMDGKKLDVAKDAKGMPLLSVVNKDGEYFWGICKNGKSAVLKVNGQDVAISKTPTAKLSDKAEWLVSVEGSSDWVSTGITDKDLKNGTPIIFFTKAEAEGDNITLTQPDATVLKLPAVGDGMVSVAERSVWFTRLNQTRKVALTTYNVKSLTITNIPDDWGVEIIENELCITSPAEVTEINRGGMIEIQAEFNKDGKTAVVSVDVEYDEELVLEADAYGAIKVTVSEHVEADYAGYILKAWSAADFSIDAVVEWLNGEGRNTQPYKESSDYEVAEIAEDFTEGKPYMIFAVSAIAPEKVASGEMLYKAEDILTAAYAPTNVSINVSEINFDSAYIQAEFKDVARYHAGIASTENWNNYMRKNVLELLGWGGQTPLEAATYEGPACEFPDGEININILPSTDYTIWMIPYNEENKYDETGFITKTFTTTGISADTSIPAPSYELDEVTSGGFTATVTPAEGAYRTFAAILPAAAIPSDNQEIVTLLMQNDKSSKGSDKVTVSTNSFSSDAEVYILAVTLNADGKYGQILKEQVELKQFAYSETVGITDCAITNGIGDVTFTLSFKGEPATITYMVASYTFYDDETIQKLMALSQYGDVIDKKISSLTDGCKINVTELELGTEYTFYAVVKDSEGNPSYMFKKTFIPSISINYVMSDAENYSYGMPEISGEWINNTSYKLNVHMPEACEKFWMSVCDSEYLTGDVWTDTDKLITVTLYNSAAYTESVEGMRCNYLNSASRVYIAWLDDKGEYHAIYEYNPHN